MTWSTCTPELFDYAVHDGVLRAAARPRHARGRHGRVPRVFAVEYLPGQFDQRADCCRPVHPAHLAGRAATTCARRSVYLLYGALTDADACGRQKATSSTPSSAREASLALPETLARSALRFPRSVDSLTGFCARSDEELAQLRSTSAALRWISTTSRFCRDYFRDGGSATRPSPELRMIDTYWSDHCRHTTFSTHTRRR